MPHAVCTPTNGVRTVGSACGPAGRRAGHARLSGGCAGLARPPDRRARLAHLSGQAHGTNLHTLQTGVHGQHACLEGVQALHALRTGVHGWHTCPARLT
ncbi:hypothetical protein PCANC_26348 [Puccinia coronata f. sp. avenae]|uniref:Uncharacterized protein n=1 Tax=Puccinia coronata f. sp. avenae TaxID=200324 RepID=A0A2N5SEX7_9BASI|nr:hypothetical protein PCANC_26348 [Puccinia coronata f. sp. avenae]